MNIAEIVKKVEDINSTSNYWFVRTEYGRLFEQFYEGGYIAIGWDYITSFDLRNSDIESLKMKVARREDLDLGTTFGKRKVTSIYNKIQNFINLKKDDIVIIPSKNSDRLAFGRICGDSLYEEITARDFLKRRKVNWLKIKEIDELNPIFYQVKSNQHTISNVNGFSKFIDREIGSLFKKGDATHYVLKIEKDDDINFNELKSLIDNIDILLKNINTKLNFEEDFDEFYVKVNLQSKGSIELIKKGKSLAVLAYVLFLTSCEDSGNNKEQSSEIKSIVSENRELLEKTSSDIDSLRININELTKPFENGD